MNESKEKLILTKQKTYPYNHQPHFIWKYWGEREREKKRKKNEQKNFISLK